MPKPEHIDTHGNKGGGDQLSIVVGAFVVRKNGKPWAWLDAVGEYEMSSREKLLEFQQLLVSDPEATALLIKQRQELKDFLMAKGFSLAEAARESD